MFNAKKKRIEQLEKQVAAGKEDSRYLKERYLGALNDIGQLNNQILAEQRRVESAEYKLLVVEQLFKQLTININMNGKGKK